MQVQISNGHGTEETKLTLHVITPKRDQIIFAEKHCFDVERHGCRGILDGETGRELYARQLWHVRKSHHHQITSLTVNLVIPKALSHEGSRSTIDKAIRLSSSDIVKSICKGTIEPGMVIRASSKKPKFNEKNFRCGEASYPLFT